MLPLNQLRESFLAEVGGAFEESGEELSSKILGDVVDSCHGTELDEYDPETIKYILGNDYVSGVVYVGVNGCRFAVVQKVIFLFSDDHEENMSKLRRQQERKKARSWAYDEYAHMKAAKTYNDAVENCSAKIEAYKIFMYQRHIPRWQQKFAIAVYPKWFQKLSKWLIAGKVWHGMGQVLFWIFRVVGRCFGYRRKFDKQQQRTISHAIGGGLSNIFFILLINIPNKALHGLRIFVLKLGMHISTQKVGQRQIVSTFVTDAFRVQVYRARNFLPGWVLVEGRDFKI